jgi:phage-related holin
MNLVEANWEALARGLQDLPVVVIALLLLVVDALYAIVRHATGRHNDTDPPILEYLEGRLTIVFILVVATILDPIIPDAPLLDATGAFYSAVCAANILDAAARDGVPVPDMLVGIVRSLRGATGQSTIAARTGEAGGKP